jgi:hypothetical protein
VAVNLKILKLVVRARFTFLVLHTNFYKNSPLLASFYIFTQGFLGFRFFKVGEYLLCGSISDYAKVNPVIRE